MSWEWSHTAEAYQNAESNLRRLKPAVLRVIWAEWKAFEPASDEPGGKFRSSSSSQLNGARYEAAMKEAKAINPDFLADYIWEQASELRTCDNGGFNAWLCPFGCGCHRVSFSSVDEIRRENLEKAREAAQAKRLERLNHANS